MRKLRTKSLTVALLTTVAACQSDPEYTRADGVTVIPMSVGADEIRDKVDGTIGQECLNLPGRVGVTMAGSYFATCTQEALDARAAKRASGGFGPLTHADIASFRTGLLPATGSPGFGAPRN